MEKCFCSGNTGIALLCSKNPTWALCQMAQSCKMKQKLGGRAFEVKNPFFAQWEEVKTGLPLNTATAPRPLTRSEQVTLRLFVSPPPSLSRNQQTSISKSANFFVCFCSRPLPSFPLSPAMPRKQANAPVWHPTKLPSAGRELSASMFLDFCFYSSSSPS